MSDVLPTPCDPRSTTFASRPSGPPKSSSASKSDADAGNVRAGGVGEVADSTPNLRIRGPVGYSVASVGYRTSFAPPGPGPVVERSLARESALWLSTMRTDDGPGAAAANVDRLDFARARSSLERVRLVSDKRPRVGSVSDRVNGCFVGDFVGDCLDGDGDSSERRPKSERRRRELGSAEGWPLLLLLLALVLGDVPVEGGEDSSGDNEPCSK
jgi:hypothetical protein